MDIHPLRFSLINIFTVAKPVSDGEKVPIYFDFPTSFWIIDYV